MEFWASAPLLFVMGGTASQNAYLAIKGEALRALDNYA